MISAPRSKHIPISPPEGYRADPYPVLLWCLFWVLRPITRSCPFRVSELQSCMFSCSDIIIPVPFAFPFVFPRCECTVCSQEACCAHESFIMIFRVFFCEAGERLAHNYLYPNLRAFYLSGRAPVGCVCIITFPFARHSRPRLLAPAMRDGNCYLYSLIRADTCSLKARCEKQ